MEKKRVKLLQSKTINGFERTYYRLANVFEICFRNYATDQPCKKNSVR